MAKIIKGGVASMEPHPSSVTGSSGHAAGPSKLIDAEVYDAGRQAKQIIAAAEARAQDLLRQAERERNKVFEAARLEGKDQGFAQVTEMLARASRLQEDKVAEVESHLVELALGLCRKIIGHALELNGDLIVDIAAQALHTVRQQRDLSLRVHPLDAATLRSNQKQLVDLLSRAKHVEIREDENIPRGGVIIETEVGTIDARLDTQLEVLKRVLREAEADAAERTRVKEEG